MRTGKIDWTALKHTLAEGERKLAAALVFDEARRQALLRQRATYLAAHQAVHPTVSASHSFLVFLLGQESYALGLGALGQILPLDHLVPVPGAPATILGVMSLRGEVGTVWSLARLLNLPPAPPVAGGHVLVLKGNGEQGLAVDYVEGTREIDAGALAPASEGALLPLRFLRGLTREGVHVLDAETLRGAMSSNADQAREPRT